MKFLLDDTISAIATPIGEGALGIVRISGEDSFTVSKKIFQPKNKKIDLSKVETHRIIFGSILDDGEIIDEAVALIFRKPKSSTGEDLIEFVCHGGEFILKKVLELCIKNGARLAQPGEFTMRAFLNGKIDLLQSESVLSLIKAKTDLALKKAISQHQGKTSQKIKNFRNRLIEINANIEVLIDHDDEDISIIPQKEIYNQIKNIQTEIHDLIIRNKSSYILKDGAKIAIVGKPNAGKSSLFNALLDENKAIVTDLPGTTRDVLEGWINIEGIPILLQDTAGIRHSEDKIEKIGIQKAIDIIKNSDLVLFLFDGTTKIDESDKMIKQIIESNKKNVIYVLNKIDLSPNNNEYNIFNPINISATGHLNLNLLKQKIWNEFGGGLITSGDVILTDSRHIESLYRTDESLQQSLKIFGKEPLECITIFLRQAIESLGEITGENISQKILNSIFSRFCIGK